MSTLKVHDKEFTPYITSKEIEEQVRRVAEEINKDYAEKKPLFIAILNGAFIFAADLFKQITIEAEICFIKLAS
jgi:hypoxanthine phosphoribosyltransferase